MQGRECACQRCSLRKQRRARGDMLVLGTSRLALLIWQIFEGRRIPQTVFMGGRLWRGRPWFGRWLKPFVARLGQKARRQICPLYVSG
jgi:hypothetical protein